jgi:hypothetical protein
MKVFHICTITNNLKQYEEMKSSYILAGFTEDRCRYSLFDNSKGNVFDPSVFNEIRLSTPEPYIIFCHQDILLNQGDGYDKLIKVVDEHNQIDKTWAVAGNAGVSRKGEYVLRITDPFSESYPEWKKGLPYPVESLDENFLLIKTQADISCNIKTFYFYAHELCLDALTKGYSSYVIDFHLTHLSPGKYDHDGHSYFSAAIKAFENKWSQKFFFRYYKPMYAQTMCFSRYYFLRKLGKVGIYVKRIRIQANDFVKKTFRYGRRILSFGT